LYAGPQDARIPKATRTQAWGRQGRPSAGTPATNGRATLVRSVFALGRSLLWLLPLLDNRLWFRRYYEERPIVPQFVICELVVDPCHFDQLGFIGGVFRTSRHAQAGGRHSAIPCAFGCSATHLPQLPHRRNTTPYNVGEAT